MQYSIRPARIADAANLAQVRLETWRTAYRGLIPEAVIASMDLKKKPRAGSNGCRHRRRILTFLWRRSSRNLVQAGLKPPPVWSVFVGVGPTGMTTRITPVNCTRFTSFKHIKVWAWDAPCCSMPWIGCSRTVTAVC